VNQTETSPGLVFDAAQVALKLARAHRMGFEPFLVERAGEDLRERLGAVTRPFGLAADVGTAVNLVPQLLATSGRAQHVLRLVQPGAPVFQGEIVAHAESLPLREASLDLVVSLLALQSVNDLPGALVQMRRALKPDGLLLACLFGGATLTELRQTLLETEIAMTGGASPRVSLLADLRDMGGLLQRAGFALPVVDVETVTVRHDDMFALIRDLRAMGLGNALLARSRRLLPRRFWMEAAATYASRFSDADGRIRATFDMVWLSGWAPHASQQQPLRPGSAKSRLAQALGVDEQSAGEKPGG
jgi:SAM-dependent methyltransferase